MCCKHPVLIETILQKQQRDRQSVLIKLSIDDGGGFLELCLSILPSITLVQNTVVDCQGGF